MFDMQGSVQLQLDAAVKRNDLEFAKKLIEENPDLKEYINKKLYALAKADDTFFHAILTGAEMREATKLLAIGADPNYRPGDESHFTLLEKAVAAGDLRFVVALLEKGAYPFRYRIESLSDLTLAENRNFPLYFQHRLSVQRSYENFMKNCFDKTNNDIFDLLSKSILTEHGKEVEGQFRCVFEQIIQEIIQAKELANQENKRLMILIGENHEGLNSLVIESMVYLVAKALGVNIVLTEQDQKMLDYFNKTGKRLTRENQWGAIIPFLNLVKENNGQIVPIDIEQTKLLAEGVVPKSEGDVTFRDKTMAECANQVNADVVAVVGDGHLYGLLNKTDLTSNFHVLPISTIIADDKEIQQLTKGTMTLEAFDQQSHQVKSHEFNRRFPEKVKNLTAFQDAGYQSLISPNQAVKIVYKLFEELKPGLGVTKPKTKPDDLSGGSSM